MAPLLAREEEERRRAAAAARVRDLARGIREEDVGGGLTGLAAYGRTR